jgi:hypothetical protein
MRALAIVVGEVGCEDSPQTALAEDHDVVETLAADRADQALNEGVLPGRARRLKTSSMAHTFEAVAEGGAVDAVAVAYQVLRRAGFWERLDNLLSGPGGGRKLGHVEMQDASAIVRQHDENVEHERSRSGP